MESNLSLFSAWAIGFSLTIGFSLEQYAFIPESSGSSLE
jgi:hypothetical protein